MDPTAHVDENTRIDLLGGLLPPEAERAALAHLEQCEPCAEAFRRLGGDAIRFQARIRQAGAMRAPATASPVGRPRSAGSMRRRGLVLGAVAGVAVLALWLSRRPADPGGSVPRLPEIVEFVQWRNGGAQVEAESIMLEGLHAYARGDMAETVRRLSQAGAAGRLETLRRIYLGSAEAHQGHWSRALQHLAAVSGAPTPEPWRSDAEWTRYIALRATAPRSADSLLAVFARSEDRLGEMARGESRRAPAPSGK